MILKYMHLIKEILINMILTNRQEIVTTTSPQINKIERYMNFSF